MTNAARAIGTKHGTITINVRHDPSGDVVLTVADDGIGMDEATRTHIFEPFFTRRANAGGTGLGLSIVNGIVLAHGGSISVASAPGVGTRFELKFPARENDGGRLMADSALRILIIDDDEHVQKSLVFVLKMMGHEIFTADTAAQGVMTFAECRPDLVFVDMVMPGGGHGVDAVHDIRALDASVYIVAISKAATDETNNLLANARAKAPTKASASRSISMKSNACSWKLRAARRSSAAPVEPLDRAGLKPAAASTGLNRHALFSRTGCR